MMRLLLDENISPALVRLLADIDVYSQSVPHVGLAGRPFLLNKLIEISGVGQFKVREIPEP